MKPEEAEILEDLHRRRPCGGAPQGRDPAGREDEGRDGRAAAASRPQALLTGAGKPLPVITPDLLLRAYEIGLFPMAEDADDPSDPLDRAGAARHHPARRAATCPHRLARTVRGDRFRIEIDRDFEAVIEGCARHGRRQAPPHLDQCAHPQALCRPLRGRPLPHASRPISARSSSAGSTACRSAPLFSGRACSRTRATPRRWPSCISWPGCGAVAIGSSTRNS